MYKKELGVVMSTLGVRTIDLHSFDYPHICRTMFQIGIASIGCLPKTWKKFSSSTVFILGEVVLSGS